MDLIPSEALVAYVTLIASASLFTPQTQPWWAWISLLGAGVVGVIFAVTAYAGQEAKPKMGWVVVLTISALLIFVLGTPDNPFNLAWGWSLYYGVAATALFALVVIPSLRRLGLLPPKPDPKPMKSR